MFQISLFKVGLVAMLLLILASMVLNIVAIASTMWGDTGDQGLWYPCGNPARDRCFGINPPALIATGTALNILSFLLILVAQLALFLQRFRDSFALYFVIGAEITSILSLIFNTIGWYFVFYPQYQSIVPPLNSINAIGTAPYILAFRLGWSFWLMTPSFFCTVFATIVGAAILGCTCVTNKFERENRGYVTSPPHHQQKVITQPPPNRAHAYVPNYGYYNEPTDPQINNNNHVHYCHQSLSHTQTFERI